MGMICHNAIVITGYRNITGDDDSLDRAYLEAKRLDLTVSDIIDSPTNMFSSFFVAPDGSKEGWESSDQGDLARQAFYAFLRKECPWLSWAGVRYGNDSLEMKAYVEDCSI